ncbi:MAG: glycosyltransferase family 2 protein [Dokdonella sp.]
MSNAGLTSTGLTSADLTSADLTSVIVVSADSGPLLADCVERVLASTSDVELILVDNASTDGVPQRTIAAHAGDTRLRFVDNADNIGFGPACNRGAKIANGDVLLFVNPDCLVVADSVAQLRSTLGQCAGVGIVGADVRDQSGVPTPASRRRDPTLRRVVATLTGAARLASRWPALAGVAIPGERPTDPESVDAISGACFAIRRDTFDRLGGFDEGYFLHFEDIDLCRRVRDVGLRVLLDPGAPVRHFQGSSSQHRMVFVARHKHAGMWRWFNRFDPAAKNPLLRGLVWLGIRAHLGWFRLREFFSR